MLGLKQRTPLLLAAACLGALAFLPASSTASGRAISARVDVAMDGSSFSFEGDVNENGVPAAGTPFVISGYIYPGGTFDRNGALSGVLPDGSPQFPHDVIGTWTCRGWHLQDGDATSGPVVVTTQVFDFDLENPGTQMLVTDGMELADFGKRFPRAVTGGTGIYRGAKGEHQQVYVGGGLNASGGFNTSFDMTILPAID